VVVGAGRYSNALLCVAVCPLDVTARATWPTACAGVTTVSDVDELTVTLGESVPPKLTDVPAAKFDPVMVRVAPPADDPAVRVRLEIVGAALGVTNWKPFVSVAVCASGLATTTSA